MQILIIWMFLEIAGEYCNFGLDVSSECQLLISSDAFLEHTATYKLLKSVVLIIACK